MHQIFQVSNFAVLLKHAASGQVQVINGEREREKEREREERERERGERERERA